MEMSFDKCIDCNYSTHIFNSCGMKIFCKITGKNIIINKCPKVELKDIFIIETI